MENKTSRLKTKYEKETVPVLASEFGIKNKMASPKITKIVVNMGIGEIAKNTQLREALSRDLALITGQAPSIRRARISIANFNVVKGNPVGLSITLRGIKMYDFLDKLISIVLPRLRDFRGVSNSSFDKEGNYSFGISEHTIFPEVDLAKAASPRGLEVTIAINSESPDQSKRLLELLGMPFAKETSGN